MSETNSTEYYDRTARDYDALHGEAQNPEHSEALRLGWRLLAPLGIGSVLDVGCGTGRGLSWFADPANTGAPVPTLTGIDPSAGVLEQARAKLPGATFRVGQGEALDFADASADLVMATGILHHADRPKQVIAEMFRVAAKAVLISDHNNFAFGGRRARRLRLGLYAAGLLDIATYVKQGFRRQGYSEDDGWWYPYSVLNDFDALSAGASEVFVTPTRRPSPGGGGNFLLGHSHVAVICLK